MANITPVIDALIEYVFKAEIDTIWEELFEIMPEEVLEQRKKEAIEFMQNHSPANLVLTKSIKHENAYMLREPETGAEILLSNSRATSDNLLSAHFQNCPMEYS